MADPNPIDDKALDSLSVAPAEATDKDDDGTARSDAGQDKEITDRLKHNPESNEARLDTALAAADRIDAGGIMINDSSDYRFDAMPFGGFKYGSLGREGVRFAHEEMTQPRTICLNRS